MASTSRPCSAARRAVMSEPESRVASTTRQPRARPEMRRLRRGKFPALGGVPSGNSETSAPRNKISSASGSLRRGYTMSMPVRSAVDSDSRAAHDDHASLAERSREALRILESLRRRVSAADHGKRRGGKELRVAGNIEQSRWIGDFQELLGVFGIGKGEHPMLGPGSPFERFFDLGAAVSLEDTRCKRFGHDATELRSRRIQYVGGKTESGKQGSESLATEPGDQTEFDPGGQVAR